jgi:hypothetical protein
MQMTRSSKEIKPSTKAQVWARRRNWLKARLIGGIPWPEDNLFTEGEKVIMREIISLRSQLLDMWKYSSKVSKANFLKKGGA